MPTISISCEHQQQSNWCWAAVVASVNNYYASSSSKRKPITQQQLADRYVGGRNEQYDVYQPLVDLDLSNNGSEQGVISWDNLTAIVTANQPGIALVGQPNEGHYILVAGYIAGTARTKQVQIIDPDTATPTVQSLPYSTLDSYGGGYIGTQYTKP
jgi:hypothetical protein